MLLRRGVDVQRCLLLLGALVTFLLFAPRGLIVGSSVLVFLCVVLSRRSPRGGINERRSRSFRNSRRLSEGCFSPPQGAAAAATEGGCNQEVDAITDARGESSNPGDGDWGPALVLVFEARDPVTGRVQLQIKIEVTDGVPVWVLEEVEPVDAAGGLPCSEILERLTEADLEYRLGQSRGGEYIFCVVRLPELTARANLTFYPSDLQLDPWRTWRYALTRGMPLAIRSKRKDSRGSYLSRVRMFGDLAPKVHAVFKEGVPFQLWQDLYVRFVPTVPSALFRHYALVPGNANTMSGSLATPSFATTPHTVSGTVSEDEGVEAVAEDGPGYLPLDAPVWSIPAFSNRRCSSLDTMGPGGRLTSPVTTTILPPSERLRLLLNLVASDLPGATGGRPGLKLDQWRKPKFCNFIQRTCRNFGVYSYADDTRRRQKMAPEVPGSFLLYYLMQDPRDAAYLRLCDKFGHPASPHFRRSLFTSVVDGRLPGMLRNYFGQQCGFYFAFMQHLFGYGLSLSVLLLPLLAAYSFHWAQHVVAEIQEKESMEIRVVTHLVSSLVSEIESSAASRSRWPLWSLLVGLTTIVWGQCVIESWRRQERRLSKEWGSSRTGVGRTVRPHFNGCLALSRIDGRLTQDHHNVRIYQLRVLGANFAFLCLALGFASLVLLFSWWSLEAQVANEEYASLGVVYSVITVILYNAFKVVANKITEAENHKHEEYWEASVLVKKWMLTVIVQCWALGHLLFIRPLLWPCSYGSPEVREKLDVDRCTPGDFQCCDVELKRGAEVLLSYSQVRSEEVVRHTRQFVAGWLVSKIFVHNLLKWFVPRLCGFLCTRGLYPLFALDFAWDLIDDLTSHSQSTRRPVKKSRCWCCCHRRSIRWGRGVSSAPTDLTQLPEAVTAACELQLDKHDPWDLLDSANDLSVHFLVTSLTTVIYPFAPLLFLAHLLVEFQMDLYRLFDRRQPKPRTARGLPRAWVKIFQSYVYVGAVSNLAVVTWRTPLVSDMLGEGNSGAHFAFFSTAMLLLVLVVSLVRLVVPSVPEDVKEDLQRQQEVEAFLHGAGAAPARGIGHRQVSEPQVHAGTHGGDWRAQSWSPGPGIRFHQQEDARVDAAWREAQQVR